MKMRIMLNFCLALFLASGLAAGCSKQTAGDKADKPKGEKENLNATGYPIAKDKTTLKMMGSKAAIQGAWDQLHVFTEYEKKSNVHVEWDTPPDDGYEEKKNLAFASGSLPDAFYGGKLKPEDEIKYGQQGLLIPLEKLIDQYAPNFSKLMKADPNLKSSITAPDGHIYSLPRIVTVPRAIVPKIWINQQWLDKVGMKIPTTTDELYQVLKAFKDKDPNGNGKADEIPWSSLKLTQERPGLLAAFGFVIAQDGNPNIGLDNDKVLYIPAEPNYKNYLNFLHKLYAEGLLDKETFSQTQQQMVAKGQEKRTGYFGWSGPFLLYDQQTALTTVTVPPLTSEVNKKQIWPKYATIQRGTFAITKANKHPEMTMRWVDYFYSEEGSELSTFGIEGQDWKWMDDKKTTWERIVPEGMKMEEFRGGKVTPAAGTDIPQIWGDFVMKQGGPSDAHIDKQVAEKYIPYWKEGYPLTYFPVDKSKRLIVLETDLSTYVEQMEAKFIVGTESLDNWDKYVATLKKMGADEAVKLYQEAYDNWKKNK